MHGRFLAAIGLMAAIVVSGCSGPAESTSPLPLVPVALSLTGPVADQPIRVGVVVGPRDGEGSEYHDMADGVRVGTYRFGLTGADISITAALDDGTIAGAVEAFHLLASNDVIGIIVASGGPHIEQAIAQVNLEQPILLPYEGLSSEHAGVWSTAPSWSAVNQAFSEALTEVKATSPYVVIEDGYTAPTVTSTASETLTEETAERVVAAIQSGAVDSLIVVAAAYNQAYLISTVQEGLGVGQIPILSTPSARTPLFARTLLAGGSISSTLITTGPNTSDLAALEIGPSGAQAAAFFSSLRLAANDPTCLNVFGDAPLAKSAQTADMASHDATIALVRAAEQAGSVAPKAVSQALKGYSFKAEDGLSGPELDFSTSSALPDNTVKSLYASTQNPGVRPLALTVQPTLVWFPLSQLS